MACDCALRCAMATLLLGLVPMTGAGAQAELARVALSVTVLPQATVEQQRELSARPLGDGSTEYVAHVVVRSNASYRLIARRVGADGPAVTLGTTSAGASVTAHLPAGRRAIEVSRGRAGVTALDITFVVAAATQSPGAAIRFEAIAEDTASR